jgi:cell division initiation protein
VALTPVEIRHIRLARGLRGYKRSVTDELLAEITTSFEDVWRERADLADRVEQLETELGRYRDLEGLLRATLVTAERAATELKEHAQHEAELIVREAHASSREITRRAAEDRERLLAEARRVRAILRAALATAEEAGDAQPRQVEAA